MNERRCLVCLCSTGRGWRETGRGARTNESLEKWDGKWEKDAGGLIPFIPARKFNLNEREYLNAISSKEKITQFNFDSDNLSAHLLIQFYS